MEAEVMTGVAARKMSTFRLDGDLYGVHVAHVQEITRWQDVTPVPLAHPAVTGLMNLRGNVVTVIDLRRRLGYRERPGDITPVVVVLHLDSEVVGLAVDGVDGFVDVAPDEREPAPQHIPPDLRDLLAGAFRVDDRMVLELDVAAAVDVSHGTAAAPQP